MNKLPVNSNSSSQLPPILKENHNKNLAKLQLLELLDLRNRQEKILKRIKGREELLHDKGKRLKDFHENIMTEIKRRQTAEDTINLFKNSNISSPSNDMPDNDDKIEPLNDQLTDVNGSIDTMNNVDADIVELDVSEVMKNIALKIPTTSMELKKEAAELQQRDLILINKVETNETPESFKLHKTTKSNVHDAANEKTWKRGKYWEKTAATPNKPLVHHGTKTLSIFESNNEKKKHAERIKKLQAKHGVLLNRQRRKLDNDNVLKNLELSLQTFREPEKSDDVPGAGMPHQCLKPVVDLRGCIIKDKDT